MRKLMRIVVKISTSNSNTVFVPSFHTVQLDRTSLENKIYARFGSCVYINNIYPVLCYPSFVLFINFIINELDAFIKNHSKFNDDAILNTQGNFRLFITHRNVLLFFIRLMSSHPHSRWCSWWRHQRVNGLTILHPMRTKDNRT